MGFSLPHAVLFDKLTSAPNRQSRIHRLVRARAVRSHEAHRQRSELENTADDISWRMNSFPPKADKRSLNLPDTVSVSWRWASFTFIVVLVCLVYVFLGQPAVGYLRQTEVAFQNTPVTATLSELGIVPTVLIAPHHLVAQKQIDDSYAQAAKARADIGTRRIILISPNHFFRGIGNIITAAKDWPTRFGRIAQDAQGIDYFLRAHMAERDDAIVGGDHGITVHLPFIKEYFPHAELLPLVMREPLKPQDASLIASFINQHFSDDTLIIASIDFSHYLPRFVADFHDRSTIAALHNLDFDFFEKHVDADSPQILMVLAELLRVRGQERFTLLHHTNSSELIGTPYEKETTSHIIGVYSEGKREVREYFSVIAGRSTDNPLVFKGADFAYMLGENAPRTFEKYGMRVTVKSEAKPFGIAAWRNKRGRVYVERCFFETEECVQ